MKHIFAVLLAFTLVISGLPVSVNAAETYGYDVLISPNPVTIGSEVTLTIRLTDYTEEKSPLLGFQIDITDVNDVLTNAVCTSLITDKEDLLSDVAQYQPARDIVRHFYLKMNGTMAYSVSDLLEVKFTIPETYTEAGTLSLPLRILIANEAEDQLTYQDTIKIHYGSSNPPDPDVVNVDISWGSMNYTYTEGIWKPDSHRYDGSGWTDNGSGYVIITNNGTVDTTATCSFTSARDEITGSFTDGTAALVEAMDVIAGQSRTVYLVLSGKPTEQLNKDTIGTLTVTIGGN